MNLMVSAISNLSMISPVLGNNVSEVIHGQTDVAVTGCISLIICGLGVATNTMNCLVFSRQGLRDRMNLCLFMLSLVDCAFCLCACVHSTVSILHYLAMFGVGEEQNTKQAVYLTGVMYAFRATSGCYTMVISVERCFCVLLPFRATSLIRTQTMAIMLATIGTMMQLGFATVPLKYYVVSEEVSGVVYWRLELSRMWLDNRVIIDMILDNVMSISLPLLTFVIVVIATIITVVKLKAAMLWRDNAASSSSVSR